MVFFSPFGGLEMSRTKAVTLMVVMGATFAAGPLPAQVADSVASSPKETFFTRRDALIAGGFLLGTIGLAQVDQHLAHFMQRPSLQGSVAFDRGATFFNFMGNPAPEIIGVGLYGVGRLTNARPVAALGLHGLEALLLSKGITTAIKGAAGRARPYVDDDTSPHSFGFMRGLQGRDFSSFPSGHTATAFAVAAAATAETSHWVDENHWPVAWKYVVGVGLFGGATMVGMSRMYDNQHWASDVIGGAAIGTFAGIKTVQYAYRHPNNRIERLLLGTTVMPSNGGMTLMWTLPVGPTNER